MKIRIKGNSIRFRLSKSEVNWFGKEGHIEEATEFGSQNLTYALQRVEEGKQLSAGFSNNKITLFMPAILADEWLSTDWVGYDNDMYIGNSKKLFLMIEKDFKCLDNTNEDQSDMYDNPLVEKK